MLEADAGARQRVVYVPTITLGNIATIVSVVLAIGGGLMRLEGEVTATAVELRDLKETVQSDRRDIKDALLRIENKLDGKADKRFAEPAAAPRLP